MSDERVVLTARCKRRGHLVLTVVDTGHGLVVYATHYAAGRNRPTWTPGRFPLKRGNGRRYGCQCGGRGRLIRDDNFLDYIATGDTREWRL